MSIIRKFLSEAFFPNNFTCDLCGIETFGTNFCPDCAKSISYNDGFTCPVCGRSTYRHEICIECKDSAPVYKKAVSALVYEGGAIKLIAKYKNGDGYLKEYFADIVTKKLDELPLFDCIVYVPMTKKAERKRGYNQSELLANGVSMRYGIPVIKNAVVKIKDTSEQKSLSRNERAKNLVGTFKVAKRNEIKGKNVLLIDDILTTGATAAAICKILLKAGAWHVILATIASVEYKL